MVELIAIGKMQDLENLHPNMSCQQLQIIGSQNCRLEWRLKQRFGKSLPFSHLTQWLDDSLEWSQLELLGASFHGWNPSLRCKSGTVQILLSGTTSELPKTLWQSTWQKAKWVEGGQTAMISFKASKISRKIGVEHPFWQKNGELGQSWRRLDQPLQHGNTFATSHPPNRSVTSPDFTRAVCDLAGIKSSDGTSPSFVSTCRVFWPSSEMVMECEIAWATQKHLLSFSAYRYMVLLAVISQSAFFAYTCWSTINILPSACKPQALLGWSKFDLSTSKGALSLLQVALEPHRPFLKLTLHLKNSGLDN